MREKLRMLFILIIMFLIASFLAVYSYGLFVKRAKGEASYTLPVQPNQTSLDQLLTKELQTHSNQSGLMLLTENLDAFTARAVSAREAGRSLDLQYYIWNDDLTGQILDYEILQAADRGVRVRMLLDDMNAHGRSSVLAALNEHPNIEVRLFNPTRAHDNALIRGIEMLLRAFSVNRRMHNKAWIVDNRIAIVGGRNIGDEYFSASKNKNFFDADLLISGIAVNETSVIFDQFWNSVSAIPLRALVSSNKNTFELARQKATKNYHSNGASLYIKQLKQTQGIQGYFDGTNKMYWTDSVHVYSDPPEKAINQKKSDWLIYKLLPIWNEATKTFQVISPYFVPMKTGVKKFSELRDRGVDVNVLTNSLAANDVLLVHAGYSPYRKPLLQLGVNLYELKSVGTRKQSFLGSSGASLHTKAFLIDERTGFVGSFNFDPRSAMLNTEMGIIFNEPTIVAELLKEFNYRTSADYSYQVILQDGQLRWKDKTASSSPTIWDKEPHTKWWQRLIVDIARYLPIESQL